jgi:hypothetical protein
MSTPYPPEYDTEQPIGCRANVTFNGDELNATIGFADDPYDTCDPTSPWYIKDIDVFYYLNKEEEEQLHGAVNEGAKGFAVDGEIEIIIDSDFEYIFL